MLDDCYKKDDQQKFVRGLQAFEKRAKKELDRSFIEASPAERSSLLKGIESEKDSKDDLAFYYSTVKRLTIQAYTTSEYYMTNVQVYEMVPSRYHGCVPLKAVNSKPS
jgi:hypothetical protein